MAYIQDVQESVPALPEAGNLTSFVVLSQNENGRKLLFKIVGIDIPSGSTATFSGTKPDGVVYSTTGTISGNIVTVNEDIQMTAVAGSWDAKIRVLNGGNVIASAKVRITIDADPVAPGSIPSDSQLDGIVAECQAYAEEARSSAYGSPLTASTAAGMIDKTRVYVYTGSETGYTNGHWYYWDGSAWADGGTYNSSGIQTDTTLSVPGMAADAKAVGDELTDVNEDLEALISRGTGLNDTQKSLIITILRNGIYSTDQSDNIDQLEETFTRTVTSVSAVLDLRGDTIYTDDTLDTLRQYLTVTATFDDSTSEIVTGYSLSGTLTAGTSTITITYREVSSTVSVPVSQAVIRYNITNNLTGVTNSNTDTTIAEGNTYTGVLTAETTRYIPSNVVVTLGGTDVTSTAYDSSTYTITIPSVDGDITITATEAEDPTLPEYELTSALVVGDATDPRINDSDNCRIATGVTVNDNEAWTICMDFTSLLDANVVGGKILNNNNQAQLYYSVPNWKLGWHGSESNIKNDYNSGVWKGLNWIAIITHEANSLTVNVYGTAEGTITKASIPTASSGQVYIGNTNAMGTINRFALYKRVLTSDEITAWIGE